MTRWSAFAGVFVTIAFLAVGLAFGQQKQADCAKVQAPAKVEGLVLRVDPNAGTITVRERNGTTHVFQASKEIVQDMKPGDQIEAKLREVPKCP